LTQCRWTEHLNLNNEQMIPAHMFKSTNRKISRYCRITLLPPTLNRIVQGMKRDQKKFSKNDSLLHQLAGKLVQRVAHSKHHDNYTRSRLCQLAELVLNVRSSNAALRNADMRALINPCHYTTILEAVSAISGYSENIKQSHIWSTIKSNTFRPQYQETCNATKMLCTTGRWQNSSWKCCTVCRVVLCSV